jgi:hypothetical protein
MPCKSTLLKDCGLLLIFGENATRSLTPPPISLSISFSLSLSLSLSLTLLAPLYGLGTLIKGCGTVGSERMRRRKRRLI